MVKGSPSKFRGPAKAINWGSYDGTNTIGNLPLDPKNRFHYETTSDNSIMIMSTVLYSAFTIINQLESQINLFFIISGQRDRIEDVFT